MVFFKDDDQQQKKKKKGSDAKEEKPAESAVKESKKGGSKKDDGLSKLIDESVPETALLTFKDAPKFVTLVNGTEMAVGLLLPVDRIGGLDQKIARKSSDKGQMLACIENDEIQVYATPDMLSEGKILFIPTGQTLGNMDEYSFLRQASYDLVAVDSQGELHPLDKDISFMDAVKVNSGEMPLSSIVGGTYSDDFVEDEPDIFESPEPDMSPDFTAPEPEVDDMPEDDVPFNDDSSFSDTTANEDVTYDDIPDDFGFEPESDVDNVVDDEYSDDEQGYYEDENGEPVYDEDIEEEQVRAAFSRRFYSDELGLEVSLAPFDAQFMQDNPTLAFSEDYDDQWLSGYLRQMARDGNLELRRLHQSNISRLRENYFNLMARSCEDIQRILDISSKDTVYGKKLHRLDEKKKEYLSDMQESVVGKRNELNADYDRRREQYAENAAATARQQFDSMYSRQHTVQLNQLEPAAYERLESEYQSARRDILSERRDKASKMLDYKISDVMTILTDEYRTRLEGEQKRFEEIRNDMQKFLDENRKDEVARVHVLAEELERNNQVQRTVEEYQSRIDAMAAEHAAKKAEFESEMQALRMANDEALRRKDEEAEKRVADAKKATEDVRAQLAEANDKYYKLDEKKNEEYAARMQNLRDEKQMLADRMDDIVETHKKHNTISTFLVIVIVIAALAIGFIAGEVFRSPGSAADSEAAIAQKYEQEYQRRLDELESKYNYQAPAQSTNGTNGSGNID